ncbi:hypothetical protein [Kitasatospora purpeofusca]|uniref:hypothetical protein n=1 Tax=Kitasatospora purpeofusca TaxID=67352 RepID=UPI0036D363F6
MQQLTAPAEPEQRGGDSAAAPATGRGERVARRFEELRGRRWFWPAALGAGYVAEVLFRLVLARGLTFPSVHPDEESYLVLARVLAGRGSTEMPVGVVIPGGYALLISPALRIADDPATAYRLVMGINALVSALVLPLGYIALRRLGLERPLAYLFGAATALLPPVVFYSHHAMTDALLPALILAWLLCLHGWLLDGPLRRRVWYAVGAGASAGYAMATHDRGGVVVALTALVFLGVLVFRLAPWRSTVAGLGALAVAVAGAEALAAWLHAQFTVENSDTGGYLWRGLTDPEAAQRTLTRTTGQIWSFIVSTWGIGGLAVVVCLVAVFRRRFALADRIVGGTMVALLVGTALAAAAALPDDGRVDDWVYARYTSYLVPAAFVTGVAVLCRCGRRALAKATVAAAVLTVVLAEAVILSAGSKLHSDRFVIWGAPDISFLASEWNKLAMGRTTAAALIVLTAVVLMLIAGGRRVLWAAGVALTAFAAFATATITDQVTQPHHKQRVSTASGFTHAAGLKAHDSVVFTWDVDWPFRSTQAFQVYLGRVWYRDPRWQPLPAEATALVTPVPAEGRPEDYWPGHPAEWYVERTDPAKKWVLWRKR